VRSGARKEGEIRLAKGYNLARTRKALHPFKQELKKPDLTFFDGPIGKNMSRDDELRDLLDKTASEIKRLSSNPRTWLSWMVYLLAALEKQATDVNPANKDLFKDMLTALEEAIRNRFRRGGW
jgi:hypothetical protein